MAISHQHELHRRRLSRNVGVGGVLFVFVALLFALSFVKVTAENNHAAETRPAAAAPAAATSGAGAGQ